MFAYVARGGRDKICRRHFLMAKYTLVSRKEGRKECSILISPLSSLSKYELYEAGVYCCLTNVILPRTYISQPAMWDVLL